MCPTEPPCSPCLRGACGLSGKFGTVLMTTDPGPALKPTVEETAAIIVITDPIIRNLRITECYHRLALAVRERTGLSANWCAFATWASRQAGRTIRGEDLLEKLVAASEPGWTLLHPIQSLWRYFLRRGIFHPNTRLGRLVRAIHSPFDAFERASDAVARGNRKVFEEIGVQFADYLHACPRDASLDSEAFRAFLQHLTPGAPPDGQNLLRLAFMEYEQQRSESNAAERAQLIFLANLRIGLHEQTRLQPEIREALEAAPDTVQDLGSRALSVLLPSAARLGALVRRPLASMLTLPGRSFRRFLRDLTRRVITESTMVLTLPRGVVLALGRHLAYPFPETLQRLDLRSLRELVNNFEPATAPDDCGADDWADLSQRMHLIVHLFRAFHERPELFDPPFTAEQAKQILSGIVPEGKI